MCLLVNSFSDIYIFDNAYQAFCSWAHISDLLSSFSSFCIAWPPLLSITPSATMVTRGIASAASGNGANDLIFNACCLSLAAAGPSDSLLASRQCYQNRKKTAQLYYRKKNMHWKFVHGISNQVRSHQSSKFFAKLSGTKNSSDQVTISLYVAVSNSCSQGCIHTSNQSQYLATLPGSSSASEFFRVHLLGFVTDRPKVIQTHLCAKALSKKMNTIYHMPVKKRGMNVL